MNTILQSASKHFASKRLLFLLSCFFLSFSSYSHNPDNPLALICPDLVTVHMEPCDFGYFLDYAVVNWSSTEPVINTFYDPPQGTFLTAGNHPLNITVLNADGSSSSCDLQLTVNDPTHFFICEPIVEVSLETNCFEEITYDEVVEPTSVFCPDDILLTVTDPLGNVVIQGPSVFANISWVYQQYTISVTELSTGINCWAPLNILPNTVFNVICPNDKTIACHESLSPSHLGSPTFQTCFEESQITLTYKDFKENRTCPDSIDFILLRTWTAENPFGETEQCVQTITGKRFDLSEVVFPTDFDGIANPVFQCSDSLVYPELVDTSITGVPLVNGFFPDLVTCDFTVTYSDILTNICGESYEIDRKWKVVDWCSTDIIEHVQKIIIEDLEAPVFETQDTIWVSSMIDCPNETQIPPATILSECGSYTVEVRLPHDTIYTNGGAAFVVLSNGAHRIDYFVTDACGNMVSDSSIIFVEPAMLLSCPFNQSISCNEFYDDLETPLLNQDLSVLEDFGMPEFYANCYPSLSESAIVTIDSCGEGTIERIIQTDDFQNPITCNQTISVNHVSDMVVQFPEDLTVNCTDELPPFGDPIISGVDCESISINYTDELFEVVPDACFKIVRKWMITNYCQYDSTNVQQVVEVPESLLDSLPNCDLNADGLCDDRTFKDGLTQNNFPNAQPDGYIEYQQVIKVVDFVPPNIIDDIVLNPICIEDNSCGTTVTFPMPEVIDCGEVTLSITGDLGTGTGPFFNIPPGTHSILYSAFDMCGNSSSLEKEVTVLDCKEPSAICKTAFLIELVGPICEVDVFASSFNESSFDNCPGTLTFSFSQDINDIKRVYDQDYIGQNPIEIWVTDEYGNQSSCQSNMVIEDISGLCEPTDSFIGNITTPNNQGVKDATVTFSNSNGIIDQMLSESDGLYYFDIDFSQNLLLSPEKDFNPLNGVTTFDLVLIQKHILFITEFTSPYQFIAADANNSGSVTIFDAVVIKKVILFIDPTFPNNDSWRFVDKSYVFPNPNNPWQEAFPETIEPDPQQAGFQDYDFVGVKIGDLNSSADPQNLMLSDDRNFEGEVLFNLQEIHFQKGETIEIPVELNRSDIAGYQFTLEFDNEFLELIEIVDGFSNEEDFGFKFINKGILTSSWVGEIAENEQIAFSIIFQTIKSGSLSETFNITNQFTIAEAYSNNLELLSIALNFEEQHHSNVFEVYPVQPNPFNQKTSLPFYIPKNGETLIEIIGADGSLIFSEKKWLEAGKHEKQIEQGDLNGPGIYFYKIQFENHIKIGKMLQFNN